MSSSILLRCGAALACGLALLASLAGPADRAQALAPPRSQAQDFVFMAEARPVLIRVHARIDGKPVQQAWKEFMQSLFRQLDTNGDGVLSQNEAERAPSPNLLRAGILGALPGAGGGTAPKLADLDLDGDGRVSLMELTAYYGKAGVTAFSFDTAQGPANPQLAALRNQRPEPGVDAVSKAIFTRLDTDGDGTLSRKELAAAAEVLLALDSDDDEILSPAEVVPASRPSSGAMVMAPMMRGGGRNAASARAGAVVALPSPNLVKLMQDRYGARGQKLTRRQLNLDEATFRALDVDGDGSLNDAELEAFARRKPDLELDLDLGGKQFLRARADASSPVAPRLQVRNNRGLLNLGATRAELRGKDEPYGGADALAGIIKAQLGAQFKAADKDGNGYVDAKEAEANPLFRSVFKAMDRDGDGKVTEKEVDDYLELAQKTQDQARASSVALVVSDQSRGLFDLLDTNRDGKLGIRELRNAPAVLKELGLEKHGFLTRGDLPRSYRLELRRGQVLTGNLAAQEAAVNIYRVSYGSDGADGGAGGPMWFRRMDRNRDGDISRKEWLFSDEKFREIDTDGDGLISVEEAVRYEAKLSKQK